MGFLKINRLGEVSTKYMSPNQCKEQGHIGYKYHIAIKCCDTNLDKNKFIIDHDVVHNAIERLFNSTIDSCESMVLKIQKRVSKLCEMHGIQVVDMYIRLAPVLDVEPKNMAFMEYSMSGSFQ